VNVDYLGVLAEPHISTVVLMIVSLLGTATLWLLTWAHTAAQQAAFRPVARVVEPLPAPLRCARMVEVRLHRWSDVPRACGASRAPPGRPPRPHASVPAVRTIARR
jgi:hypothetical protein